MDEQKYELIVDNLLDIIVELDLYGNFIFVSPQSFDITGYHQDELIGTSLYQCVHPNDLSILRKTIEDVKNSKNHISLEFRIKHKNGHYIYLSAKGRLVTIDGKQKIIVMARDFSRKKFIEQKLKESEELLNDIIDQTFVGFAIFQDFEIKFFNPKFSKVIGYTYEEIMNWEPKEFFKIIHPQDREKFISLVQRVYLGDNDALNSFQFRILKKSGDKIWFEIQTKPINYKGNKADLVFLKDVTPNKEAEQKLIESGEQYRILFENSPYAICLINKDGIIVHANSNNEKISGYKREDIVGRKFTEYSVFSIKHTKIIIDSFKKLIKGEIPDPQELLLHKKDGGKIWVLMHASILKLDNEKLFQIITQDISKQKEASEKLKEKNIELSVLNRIITIGNESTNLKEFLEKSYDQVLDFVGFDRGGVYLYNPETHHNFLVHHKNVHHDFIAAVEDVDISAGLFSTIFDKHNPFYIEDFSVFIENSKELGIYSVAIIPLRSKDKYVGSMNIGSPIHQVLSDNELELLVAIGKQMGIIIQKFESERSLKESEERLKIIYKYAPDAYYLNDMKGNFVDGNDAAERLIGFKKEQLIGKSFLGILPETQLPIAIDLLRKNRNGINTGPDELFLRHKDGREIPVEIRAHPIKINDQHLVLGIARDITERKIAEQKLKESEEKFRTIAEQSLMGITIVQDDVIAYANQAILDIFGYSLDEIKSWQPLEYLKLFPPNDRAFILGQERKQQEGYDRSIHNYQVQFFKKNGESGWLDLFSNPIKYKGSLGSMVSVIDITERKKSELKLKESEENYRFLFENSIEGIWVIDSNTKTSFINPSMADMIGYHVREILGKSILNFVSKSEKNDILNAIEKRKKGITEEIERTFIHKDGKEVYTRVRASPLIDPNGNFKGAMAFIEDITEKKTIELKLKESEEKYRQLFKILPLSLILISREGIYVDCNTGTEKLFGYKREELIGKDFHSLPIIPTNNVPLFEEKLEFLFKGEILEPAVFEALRKNGESLWVNSHVSLVKIRNKNLALIIGQDITDERRAACKIKESEEKYRHLFEKSPFSIILFDSEGIIKDCNYVAEEMFGLKKDDFIGKNYFHNLSINSDHLPITKQIFEQLKEGESLLPQEIKIIRADGTSLWINSQISKIKINNQTYFYSIIQDITDKKILEDLMFELNQNFFNYTSDFQENIQSLTKTAKKLSKGNLVLYAKKLFHEDGTIVQIITSENEVINCDFIDFKQKYFINEIFELKLETPKFFPILSKDNYTLEDPFIQKYSLKGAFGKIIKNIDDFTSIIAILYEKPPEISHEEQLVLLLVSDAIAIEEQRWQLLEKLEEQNAKLSEIDKLKSEFLRRISHELKTPLISIKGYSQLILYNNKHVFDDDTLAMIEEITRGCVRLENLIRELIESSKLESAQVKLKPTFEDLSLLINNSVKELQGVAKSRNQEIILNIHEKLITKFEKERIYEVIGNLLTNAIKYSPPSNSIIIKSEITNGFYVISVKDNGIGFIPEEKQKLFKQFGKIHRFDPETNLATDGSGLGLYIAKKLVELHGGKIWVESEGRNKGSTFYFTLPIIKE